MGPLRPTETEVDDLAQLAGDLAAILTVTAIATVAVGLATFVFVRAARAWRRDPGVMRTTTRTAILGTFFIGGALEWLSIRPQGFEASHVNPLVSGVTAVAILLLPVLLIAWVLGAVVRGRSPRPAERPSSIMGQRRGTRRP
jgi:hypothetical protein